MKWVVSLVFTLLSAQPLWSQKEQDFAARYMQEIKANAGNDTSSRPGQSNKEGDELELITISPRMLQEVTERVKSSKGTVEIFSHIKSIRIVKANCCSDKYRTEALELLGKNKNRYQPYNTQPESNRDAQVWMRKKGEKIVEIITLDGNDTESFLMVNVTGEMDSEFIKTITKM